MKTFFVALLAIAPMVVAAQAAPPREANRAELQRKADELRERNAREREAIQKGFVAPSPADANSLQPTLAQVCRAAIGALMGREPKIINITRQDGDVVFTRYARPGDGTVWENRCRLQGNVVHWATATGRWRTDPAEEVVTYAVTPTRDLVIKLRHADGSTSMKPFPMAGL